MKAGIKSSEFWMNLSALAAATVLVAMGRAETSFVLTVLASSAGYTTARTYLKHRTEAGRQAVEADDNRGARASERPTV